MANLLKKSGQDMESFVKEEIINKLNTTAVIQVIDIIMEEYDKKLNGRVIDRNSKTRPEIYQSVFEERLMVFEFVKEEKGSIVFETPDMENFDFTGRLRVLKTILEGTSGIYVEVNAEDYEKIFGKKPINEDPLDTYVPKRDIIYLLRYNAFLRNKERDLNKKFVRYPFSNTPSIDIFGGAEEMVNLEIDNWINNVLDIAEKKFVTKYKQKGVI
jgi:hypothetical protein